MKHLQPSPIQMETRIFSVLSLFCQTIRLVLATTTLPLSCTLAWAPSPAPPTQWCKLHHKGSGKTARRLIFMRGFRLSIPWAVAAPSQQLMRSSSQNRPCSTTPLPTMTWCTDASFGWCLHCPVARKRTWFLMSETLNFGLLWCSDSEKNKIKATQNWGSSWSRFEPHCHENSWDRQ